MFDLWKVYLWCLISLLLVLNEINIVVLDDMEKKTKYKLRHNWMSQPVFTCSKSAIDTLEQGVKYVKINDKDTITTSMTSVWCLYC